MIVCVKMLIMQSKSQLAKLLCVCAKRRRRMRRGERVRACARSPGGSYDAWRASASLAKPAVAGAENRAARQVCNANCAGRQPCSSLSVRLVARRPPAEERAALNQTSMASGAQLSSSACERGFAFSNQLAATALHHIQHALNISVAVAFHTQHARSTQHRAAAAEPASARPPPPTACRAAHCQQSSGLQQAGRLAL